MQPKGKADLAHPEAADWVTGTLGPAEAEDFQRHLTGCPHCQAAVAEFGQLGQMLQHLPPAAGLPPGLEARVIAGVLAAAAEDRTPTRVQQSSAVPPATAGDRSSTQVIQIPATPPEAGADERSGGGMAKVIRFPRWHGRAGLLASAGAVAAAIIAAVVILRGLGGGIPAQAVTLKLGSPSGQAASGVATARPDASGSWDITLSVQHLTNLGNVRFYECWYVGPRRPGGRQVVSAGTFIVGDNGSGTFSMTSAVDPHQFRTMEIIAESPSNDGSPHGTVVLTGQKSLPGPSVNALITASS
jgi:hypothetical protein